MFLTVIKPLIWIDFSIIGLCSTTLIVGTLRGFSREVVSLLCWVVGFWTSLHFCVSVSPVLQPFIFAPNKRLAVTFISLLVVTVLFGGVLEQWLTTRFKQTYKHTPIMERLGGLLCGALQGVVVITIIVTLAGLTALPTKLWWRDSSLLPSFQIIAIWLRDHVAIQMTNL